MIKAPNSDPMVVTFVQKHVSKLEAGIASEQISKAARAEVAALTALDNASFRLVKATEQMKIAEIAYHEAVAKGASNRESLRSAYNNTLAGYRDADRNAEKAAENMALAKAAIAGLRSIVDGTEIVKVATLDEVIQEAPIEKDAGMKAFLVLCPSCMGDDDNCDQCDDNSMVSDDDFLSRMNDDDDAANATDDTDEQDDSFGKAFSTESLLTRDFQKSAAYQEYILSKGGPGSGPEVGHEFRGNQWTGGVSTDSKGNREGWKSKMGRYAKAADDHFKAAQSHEAAARALSGQGKHEEAAARFREAAKSYEKSAGAHYGIHAGLRSKADHPDVIAGTRMPEGVGSRGDHYDKADAIRTNNKAGMLYQADLMDRRAAKAG